MNKSQLIDNFLAHTHRSLREGQRFLQDGSSKSYFELFWDTINNAFSAGLRGYRPPNYTVESFYRGTLDVKEFSIQVRETVIDKHMNKLDVNCDPLLTISWDHYSFVGSRKKLCESIPKLCRRHLWGIFNKLDYDSSGFASLEDVIDVILKIHEATGIEETEENIREWFCGDAKIDFWCFFSALAETHSHLLTPSTLQTVYDIVFYEILKEGKMKKKGHKVASWRERWFVLSTAQLSYYESQENRNLKGTVTINSNSVVEKLPHTKDFPYLFRLIDGKSKVPYDISCPDPQKMNDWIEILQVTIKAHSENGYSTLHKLREAKRKLFPSKYPSSPTPCSPLPKVMPASTTNFPPSLNTSTDTRVPPYPTTNSRQDMELPPIPKVSSSPVNDYEAIKSGPGPKIQPYKKDSASDLALIHQSNIPQSKPLKTSNSSGAVGEPTYVNFQPSSQSGAGGSRSNELEDTLNGVTFSLSSTSPPPPPQNRDVGNGPGYVNVNHVTVGGYDYAMVSKGKVDEETPDTQSPPPPFTSRSPPPSSTSSVNPPPAGYKPAPAPRKRPLKQSKSVPTPITTPAPNISTHQNNLDYPILEFGDGTTSTSQQVVEIAAPKPLSPKQDIDYTEVLLDGTVKDVDTAVQLKGNRPPPTPPSKYTPKPQLSPPLYQNVQSSSVDGGRLTPGGVSARPSSIDESSPPPPPPPRRQSKRPPEVL